MLVSVFMDIEDPIHLAADDAALDFARSFAEAGVRGSFCVTGEKCRVLVERGRADVLEALRPHCLGLHTDTHSVHPTTMELMADLDYDEGLRQARHTEAKGVEKFRRAFGRLPAFWGGAGNTWSPEIAGAIVDLGIPAYAYALTSLPGEPVHRYSGALAFPQHISISEDAFAEGPNLEVLEAIEGAGRPWTGVFVGHPTRFRHIAYWDTPYAAGRQPAQPETTPEVPIERFEREKANQRAFLEGLKQRFEVVGLDEEIVRPRQWREPTTEELDHFRRQTEANIRAAARWPIHRPDLDPAGIVAKALARSPLVEA